MSQDGNLAEMMVAEVLASWPCTARVFHRHNMACVGCAVAPFYTIGDAVNVYGLHLEPFVAELEAAIAADRLVRE